MNTSAKITPMTLVKDLCLSVRASKALAYSHPEVKTVWQLAELSPGVMLRAPNFGKVSLHEIEQVLLSCGLCLEHHEEGAVFFEKLHNPWFAFCL